MSSAVQSQPLGRILDRLIDYRGKTPEKTTSGIKLITAKVIKGGRIEDENHEFIAEENYDSWMRRGLPQQWDVLITTEAPLGEVAMLRTTEKIALAQRVILLRANGEIADQNYLYQALKSPLVQSRLQSRATGTTVLGIKQSELVQVEIPLPDLPVQRRIASILSGYDDLIENNTRRIAILEEMARRIFDEWFVRFRFPGHENVRMVESELGPVPEGWAVLELGDAVEEIIDYRGKTPTKLGGEWKVEGIAALSALNVKAGHLVNLDKCKFVDEDLYRKWMKTPLRDGDVLMTSEAPLGELYFLSGDPRYCLSQRLFGIRANEQVIAPVLLYMFLRSAGAQAELASRATGATVSGIRQAELRKIPVLAPAAEVQRATIPTLASLVRMVRVLDQSNANLRKTRDHLLPNLISGELDVSSLPELEAAVA